MMLSILIASLQSRDRQLRNLMSELWQQIGDRIEVEVIPCVDNKENTTGYKRQKLLEAARGKYIIFIDDDDWPEPHYVNELLIAAESDADCFAIKGWITTNGTNKMEWRLSKDYDNRTITEGSRQIYERTTNHITAVKRMIALQGGFPNISNREDAAYSENIKPYLKTEHKIDKYMYTYNYSTINKEYK